MSLVTAATAATHVTAIYDLGANPQVMTTVGGQPQYGLVFAQRNKSVTYNSVEYSPSVVKGYLNASGELNDGAGNLWLDLVPNLGATPADSYYVVTVNIQGRVHAEIWVLPDVSTVAAETVRQLQPPSATSGGFDLSIATGLLALAHGGTGQSIWIADRCVRVNSAGTSLESAASDCGTGGGSAPVATATVSGTVKTDSTVGDPVVYLTTTADTLLAGKAALAHSHAESDVTNLVTDLAAKAPTSRSVSTSSPLAGGGTLAADLTLSCPTCEVTGNKNAASGYAGLTASTKLTAGQGQEVWSSADLTDFADKSGTGTTILGATVTSPGSTHYLGWSGTNWVNRALASGDLPAHNHAATDINSGTFAFARGGTNQTSWTASRCVRVNDAGTALESASGDCGTGGGGGDNISINGAAATDADFDDATPAAPANAINAKWQKDSSSPNNISAHVPYAAPLTVTSGNLTLTTSPAAAATVVGTGRTLTGGAGIASLGDLSADRTVALKYSDTLAANPALNAKECVFTTEGTSGGGFLCEGTTANTNEQLYLFPALDGADSTAFFALGDSSGSALAGDSATGFFGTGTLEDARLSANVSLLGQTISGSELGNPAVGTKGGVEAKTCSGTDKLSAIGTDGIPVCSADETGAGGGDAVSVNGASATDADFDDADPAAPANGVNVRWQINTTPSPDSVSAHLLTTDIGTTTFGGGSELTWTFDAGATDPTLRFGSGEFQFTGNVGIGVDPTQPLHVETSAGSGNIEGVLKLRALTNRTALKITQEDSGGATAEAIFLVQGDNAADKAFQFGLTSDSLARFSSLVSGELAWGPGGAGARDVRLYRIGTKELEVDDTAGGAVTFKVTGTLNATSVIQTNGTQRIDSSGQITNSSIDPEGTGNNIGHVSKVYMIAAGCDNATAAAAWDLPASGAAGKVCLGTGPRFGVLTFADAATSGAFTHYRLPADWTGNIDLVLLYTGDTNSTNNIVWQPAQACVADGEDLLAASFTTTASATGTGPTTAGQRKSLSFSNFTMTGCAAGETMFLRIQRLGSDGSDTYAGVAQLLAVEMTIRRTQ